MNATARRQFRPFRYAGRQGAVVLESVRVDGVEVLNGPGSENVDLSATPPTTALHLRVRYELPDAILETLPPDERDPTPRVRVVLVAEEAATWFRRAVPLEASATGYRGALTVAKRDLRDVLELQVWVARAAAGAGGTAFASELGACLGQTDRLPIRLSEPRQAPGSFMSLRWQAFSEVEDLKKWVGMPYRLQLTADPPILWLNTELAEVRVVLNSAAKTGRAAVLRELLFGGIANAAWGALFVEAARGVTRDETNDFLFGRPWHEEALRVVATYAYPEVHKRERFQKLVARIVDANDAPEGWPLLQEEAGLALMRFVALGAAVDRAAQELVR